MDGPIRILIADTWGGWPLADSYKAAFPRARFVDHAPRPCFVEPHPHGGLCASRVLLPLIDDDVEIHFVPFLGEVVPDDPFTWLLEKVAEIRPHIWSNSWGQERPPQAIIDKAFAAAWQPWVDAEAALRAEIGYLLAFAAGNTDTGGLAYKDVGYPTRLIQGAIVVGAIDRRGLTTKWSSDGNVTVSEFGHYVWVLNPLTGRWELGSGTSYSDPSEVGLLAYLMLRDEITSAVDAVAWIKRHASRPVGFTDEALPHAKFGYGSTTDQYEAICRERDAFNRTGMLDLTLALAQGERLRWFEFTDLKE